MAEAGLGGLGHEQRERAPEHPTPHNPVEGVGCVRASSASIILLLLLSLSGASAGPDNRQAASDKWPQRTAESQVSNVGGRELTRPPPSDAEGWLRLPHLVRSTES